ncbi:hypothetical protein NE237_014215 [Protea cynaroides]|uniref:Uncharacterized protein n=1 Tax=Protea cynaroides TaxID=273540 RepID=A0A9Q0GP27_9MAGN|nr:hypothetical protein NE237_014215 [Protea cynaroides]
MIGVLDVRYGFLEDKQIFKFGGCWHHALLEDPFRKLSYLFALIAGQLESRDDTFTHSGLKFFNSKLVLASPKTVSDADYVAIIKVIGHQEWNIKKYPSDSVEILLVIKRNFFPLVKPKDSGETSLNEASSRSHQILRLCSALLATYYLLLTSALNFSNLTSSLFPNQSYLLIRARCVAGFNKPGEKRRELVRVHKLLDREEKQAAMRLLALRYDVSSYENREPEVRSIANALARLATVTRE